MVGDFNRLYDEGERGVLDPSTVLGTVPLPFQGRTIDIPFSKAVPIRHSRRREGQNVTKS